MNPSRLFIVALLRAMGAAALFAGASVASAQTIGSFTTGAAAVTSGGYVSLYAKNVTASSGAVAGVRFYRESNGSSGLQAGSDTYVGMGVYADGMWTFAAPTTGLSGTQTYYAVAYDTAGNASSVASVTASVSGSGFSNWSSLQPFLAKLPLSIGVVASASVVNFGTTVYTGSLDNTITCDRIRGDNGPNRSGDGGSFTINNNPPLPTNRGSAYEFTINPQTGCTPNWSTSQIAFPGPIRFMIDTSGDVYFTSDHYSTDQNLYVAGTPSVGSVTASPASTSAGTAVTLTASGVSETISPTPNVNASSGGNVLATVCNVQFFLVTNGAAGLQTDTARLLGCGTASGSTWTLNNVSTAGLGAGNYTVYAYGVDPAGNTATASTGLTITGGTVTSNLPPGVTTSAAGGVTTNAATLNGSVNPNGQTTTAQFEYGLTASYGTVVALAGTLTGSNNIAVSTNLTGLAPATTYHFRLDATNSAGGTNGADQTFTTATFTNPIPGVTTGTATGISTNGATLNATVNPNGLTTTAVFHYGLTTSYNLSAAVAGSLTGSSAQAVAVAVTGLAPGTTYHYSISATNSAGGTNGADQSFTTSAFAGSVPGVTTGAASGIGTNGATLNATVNPNGLAATAGFQYGLTTNYNLFAAVSGSLTGSTPQAVNVALTGLAPATTYHFTIVATNSAGGTNGADQSFTTAAVSAGSAPVVTTLAASGVATNGFTFNGTVNPGGQTTTAKFFYGLTTNYLFIAPVAGSFSGSSAQAVNVALTGLPAGTTYHYAIWATNASGSVLGTDQSVTTASVNSGGGGTNYTGVLTGWDVSGQSTFGASPMAPTTNAVNVSVTGLTRGSGLTTTPTAATRAWGANGWSTNTSAAGVTGNQFMTFALGVTNGGTLSITSLSRFDYRRSSSGPTAGLLQCQVGSGAFQDLTNFSYTVSTSTGASLGPVDLSGVSALQNIPSGTNVTFRLVNSGGTASGGTWYVYDVANSTADDLEVSGTVSYPAPAVTGTPIQLWRLQWFGTTNNAGPAADTAVASPDGLPNLLKYALGLNPLTAAANPVTGGVTNGFLQMTAPRNPAATDISMQLTSAGDLTGAWNTNAIAIDQSTPWLLQGHDTNAVSGTSRRFLHLQVTRP